MKFKQFKEEVDYLFKLYSVQLGVEGYFDKTIYTELYKLISQEQKE